MRPLRRGLTAAALVFVVPVLTACGFNVQTDQDYQPAVGVNDRTGQVDVLNAVVVSAEKGSGQFLATFVNKSTTDSVKVVSIESGSGAASTLGQKLQPESALNLAQESPVSVAGTDVAPGKYVKVTIDFSNGQQTTVNAPIVANDAYYAEFGKAPESPSTSPSTSPSASPTASPTAEATTN